MRSSLPWLLLCLTGCYITHDPSDERAGSEAPNRDWGAAPGDSDPARPGSSRGETDPNAPPDPSDGEEPLDAGIDDSTDTDASSSGPWQGACGAGPDVPDVALCPERGPYCDGPYVKRKSWDGCDAVHPSWTTYDGVATIAECFELCADHPLCRSEGAVDYNPQRQSCILDASCSPDEVGYEYYVANGGCGAPEQCWSFRQVAVSQDECWNEPSGYGYFEGRSLEECILQCEKNPRECGAFDRVDYNPKTGDCMTQRGRGCVERGLGFVEYVYEEVPCP